MAIDDARISSQSDPRSRKCTSFAATSPTPSSFASDDAFSACFTVAVTFFGSNRFCLR